MDFCEDATKFLFHYNQWADVFIATFKPIHTGRKRKRKRKRKFSLVFVIYSLIFLACSLIFFAFAPAVTWCEQSLSPFSFEIHKHHMHSFCKNMFRGRYDSACINPFQNRLKKFMIMRKKQPTFWSTHLHLHKKISVYSGLSFATTLHKLLTYFPETK